MIYTRFGSPVTILAYCGFHRQRDFAAPIMLVRVRYEDDGTPGYYHPLFMKADGGAAEIDAAVDAAPAVDLRPEEIAPALAEAR